jgi:hypothetical protein
VITALTANELERIGVAAFHPSLHDADRLAPQARRTTVARLASKRESAHTTLVNAQPRVSVTMSAAHDGNGTQTVM